MAFLSIIIPVFFVVFLLGMSNASQKKPKESTKPQPEEQKND